MEKCTLCKERTDEGDEPMCVRCCPARCPPSSATWTTRIPPCRACAVIRALRCCWKIRHAPAGLLRSLGGCYDFCDEKPARGGFGRHRPCGYRRVRVPASVRPRHHRHEQLHQLGAVPHLLHVLRGPVGRRLIVASSASVFHVAEYKKVALPAVVLSTVCICCAGMFVLIDLGGIGRVWRILTGPNPMSPLFWDICVITLYLVINVCTCTS